MKRYKRLYVVLAVLLAACIATFALSRYKAQKEQIHTSGETIHSISADELAGKSGKVTIRFGRPCPSTGTEPGATTTTRPSRWTPSR